MAETEDQNTSPVDVEEEEQPSGNKKKTVFIVAIIAVLGLAVGSGLSLSGILDSSSSSEAHAEHETDGDAEGEHADSEGESHEETKNIAIVELDEMIVNITSTSPTGKTTPRFLKIKLSVIVPELQAEDFASKKPFFRDEMMGYLRQLDEQDFKGSAGILKLKHELLRRIKPYAANTDPQKILIEEILVQ